MTQTPIDYGDGDGASICSSDSDSRFQEDEAPLQQEKAVLSRRETKAVCGVRMLVFIVLFSMLAIGIFVYFELSGGEIDSFKKQYREDSTKVLSSLGASLDLTLGGLDSLVVNMASEAKASKQTWPFVTIPDFAVRAEKTRRITNAFYISIYAHVESSQRRAWEIYSAAHGPAWLEETLKVQQQEGLFTEENGNQTTMDDFPMWNVIWDYSEYDKDESEWGTGYDSFAKGPFLPAWQSNPVLLSSGLPIYNWNLLSAESTDSVWAVLDTHKVSLSDAYMIAYPNDTATLKEIEFDSQWFESLITNGEDPKEPISDVYYPIMADGSSRIQLMKDEDKYDPADHQLCGFLSASFYWRDLIKGILPEGSNGIVLVFDNPCNPSFTYQINGPTVTYLGTGDHHETKFDNFEIKSAMHDLAKYFIRDSSYTGLPVNKDICPFTVRVYPSTTMEDEHRTNKPIVVTCIIFIIFFVTSMVFLLYDVCVEKRQRIIMTSAKRSNAIVSALFPSNVHDRLMKIPERRARGKRKKAERKPSMSSHNHHDRVRHYDLSSPPIADLFPEATVLFADLAGFTAWSSGREPTQVFILLETLYGAFDNVARRRGVFKVETVGDCYVAVVGLPFPRRNHAVVLARFAAEIRKLTSELTTELELSLGPGTSDLELRCGLNSGSVTAGVLRGDKGRFQLFGDTVNTASRIESNGKQNRIHVSQKTADLLIAAGKEQWLVKREDMVEAKGIGRLQTYWVEPRGSFLSDSSSKGSAYSSSDDGLVSLPMHGVDEREIDRLIDWTVSVFEGSLRKLSAHRQALGVRRSLGFFNQELTRESPFDASTQLAQAVDSYPRGEVVTSIDLPAFQKKSDVDPDSIELPQIVVTQLRDYVSTIAHLYQSSNAFHNFAHACHVILSTKKLLQRITTHSHTLSQQEIYFHSFGLASDPLTEVAMIFSALIHDVDHPGVSNQQLVAENHVMATRYKNKSVGEQNSVNAAWCLLCDCVYPDLRTFLFTSETEYHRFRQLVVNSVMATDVFDPDLKSMRDRRWVLAFTESAQSDDPDALNRKATIVLEHLIQASDVSHTMQHWTIYQKWNRNLFREMYGGYISGRGTTDPCAGWYEGELWFFDNYIIPLAQKLQECQVFGATAQDMLDRAYENRLEWESKGRAIAEEMKDDFEKEQWSIAKGKCYVSNTYASTKKFTSGFSHTKQDRCEG